MTYVNFYGVWWYTDVWADCRCQKRTVNVAHSIRISAGKSETRSESVRTSGTKKIENSWPPDNTIRKPDSKDSWGWSHPCWSIYKKAWSTTTFYLKSNTIFRTSVVIVVSKCLWFDKNRLFFFVLLFRSINGVFYYAAIYKQHEKLVSTYGR